MYAARELAVFGTAPSPLARTLAPQYTDTTFGNLPYACAHTCNVVKYGPLYDANIAARPPQINYKSMQLNMRHP
jgi:hypothetical protein